VTANLRRGAANLAAAGVSLALVLLVAEGVSRALEARQRGGKEDRAREHYVASDPLLGWRKVPGARGVYRRREFETEVRINAMGMRDPERPPETPAAGLRLLALGDSFVEGYTVQADATMTRLLEARLQAGARCRVEVLNGGTSGWSTDQEYLYYREQAGELGARLVLLFLYYNDVLANVQQDYWGMPKPMLEEKEGRLVIAPRPTPRPGVRERQAARSGSPRETEAQNGEARPLLRSALLDLVRDRLAQGRPRLYQRLAGWGPFPRLEPERPPTELLVYRRQPPPLLQFAWRRTLRILEALRQEVSGRGERFVLVYVPAAFEVDARTWELTRFRYGLDEAEWDRTAFAQRVAGAGRRNGFEVLDLTPALRAAHRRGAVYLTYDPHWNTRGHAAAAQAVAERLRADGHLVCRGAPGE